MSAAGRDITAAAGRSEAQRRHNGRVSREATAREATRDAVREVYENPAPRPGPGQDKWHTAMRNEARRRYDP